MISKAHLICLVAVHRDRAAAVIICERTSWGALGNLQAVIYWLGLCFQTIVLQQAAANVYSMTMHLNAHAP